MTLSDPSLVTQKEARQTNIRDSNTRMNRDGGHRIAFGLLQGQESRQAWPSWAVSVLVEELGHAIDRTDLKLSRF
jgi:hypothetical protein